jgi:hypothetical protein
VSDDIGTHTVTLTIYRKKDYFAVESKTLTLEVIANATVTAKKVIFIGDSLTNAGVYPAEIQYVMSNGGIVSVGTRTTACTIGGVSYTVNHEGRSGWAAYDYTRSVADYRTDVENPFWDGSKFSFSYYMQNSEVDVPDVVCIGLGTNGGINGVADVLTMVQSIREYSATLPILVVLTAPPASQNGCGQHNGLQCAAELKNDFLSCCKNYINNYENQTDSYLDIIELYFELDTEYDFPTVTIPVSARNPQTMTVQNNNVHPSEYGYLHFADAYYNRILYWLTK